MFRYSYLNPFVEVAKPEANLPHWRQDGVTYFVTFRLADSVPQSKLRQWKAERDVWRTAHSKPYSEVERAEYYERFSARMEMWLDAGEGACCLKNPECCRYIVDILRFFDGERYELGAHVVAANHVHVVVSPNQGYRLSDIMHSWKSYSSNQVNRALKRSGTLWQKEYYDNIVRSGHAAYQIEQYISRHSEYEAQ